MNFDFWVIQDLLKRFRVLLSMSPDAFAWNKLSLIKFKFFVLKSEITIFFYILKRRARFATTKVKLK